MRPVCFITCGRPPRRSGRSRAQPYKNTSNVLDAPYKDSQLVTIQDLPVEIVRLIIGYLRSDKRSPTLKSCSRLSRSWRDLVFPYLFAAIRPLDVQRLSEFTSFVKSRPHIAPVVKEIVVFRQRRGPFVSESDITTFDHESPLVSLVDSLSALERLECSDLEFLPPTDSEAVVDAIPRSSPLRRFVWSRCNARVLSSRTALAPIFSALTLFKADTLDLIMPWTGMELPEEEMSSVGPLTFKALVLRDSTHIAPVLSSFRQTLAPDSLRSLVVSVGEPHHVAKLGELLHRVGSNLEYLRINFHNMHTPERWAGALIPCLRQPVTEHKL